MIVQPKRAVAPLTNFIVWITHLVAVALCAASIRADEIDNKIQEIKHRLLDAQIEAHEKALVSIRELQGDLVKRDDSREEHLRDQKSELQIKLASLRKQRQGDSGRAELKKLEDEFEEIEERGGWDWLDQNNPATGGPWYRLDTKKKRFNHYVKNANGKPQIYEPYSPTYEILGIDEADESIILIKMIYPPKGVAPGDEAIMRFNRKTGVIETKYGWYGKPKKG
jgi:hypothetical protein